MNKSLAMVFLGVFFLTISCGKDDYETDTGGIELQLEIRRFEKDLFSIDFDSIAEKVPWFYENYGSFFDLYNHRIINIGGAKQVTYPDYLKTFLTDYLNNLVYQETLEKYNGLGTLESALEDAFKRYMVHFPGREIPQIYSFVSRFNQSIVIDEGLIGIGLDNYLGADCEFYGRLGLHQYQVMNMIPERIPVDCMMGWAMSEFEYNDSVDNVLSNMIWNGKMAWFTRWMLPEVPDSLIMGFSGTQMQFCRNNEARMWEFMVENKVLFETDRMSILKYTGQGPFTRDFTHESPARAAVWIGWRIIEDYMKRNPDVSFEELMEDVDYQKILTLSKYNP